MVLRNYKHKMASDHPAKKKLRITNDTDCDQNSDETDFITQKIDTTNLLSLELSLPNAETPHQFSSDAATSGSGMSLRDSPHAFCNRATAVQIDAACTSQTYPCTQNGFPLQENGPQFLRPQCSVLSNLPPPKSVSQSYPKLNSSAAPLTDVVHSGAWTTPNVAVNSNTSATFPVDPSHLRLSSSSLQHTFPIVGNNAEFLPEQRVAACQMDAADSESPSEPVGEMIQFEYSIVRQCLCGVSESTLRKPFQIERISEQNGTQRIATLSEWPIPKILHFLSNLQLLFDVFLKQNNKGYVCSRLMDICTALVHDEHRLIEQIFNLANIQNKLINYLTSRVLASYFILAKTNIDNTWLECVITNLNAQNDYNKLNFSIEIIKRIVEWKDVDIHVLEEEQVTVSAYDEPGVSGLSSRSQQNTSTSEPNSNCRVVALTDHESFDTSPIKCLIIKKLEPNWPELVKNIETIITRNLPLDSECCVLNFLSLWESIISVRANLSVVETKPFYAHLEKFVSLLNFNLPFLIWRQFLSLFNEVLCYGSTLALQDILPEETCALAHLVVRYVKDFRLLDSLPYKRTYPVSSLIGTVSRVGQFQENVNNVDKTLLQKMALLVLKSVAITVKETRSDSSDSSVGSDDYDFNQDMQLIERSIRDVLKKLDSFIKSSLEYHPECAFTKVLIHLFSDQDDYMIESMVCTLDITVGIFYRNSVFPDLIVMLNPFNTFIEFLKIVSQDSDVLLDYLVSNETCFLLYLLRFLKYVRRNWSKFVHSCETPQDTMSSRSERGGLDATMAVLIRLRLQINRLVSKQLFPYNISPVLRLLETCESLYEGNEYT